jgi:hypothetical protein
MESDTKSEGAIDPYNGLRRCRARERVGGLTPCDRPLVDPRNQMDVIELL